MLIPSNRIILNQKDDAMLRKILCAGCVAMMLAFSAAEAAKYDAAYVTSIKVRANQEDPRAQCALEHFY